MKIYRRGFNSTEEALSFFNKVKSQPGYYAVAIYEKQNMHYVEYWKDDKDVDKTFHFIPEEWEDK